MVSVVNGHVLLGTSFSFPFLSAEKLIISYCGKIKFFFQLTSGFSMPWQKNHGWWSSTSREDCLNLEPLSISVTSCADSQLSFLLPPIDSSPFVSLHSYFCFKCRRIVMISMFNQNQEVFTQWEFKEQDVFPQETLQESFMLTCNLLFTLW